MLATQKITNIHGEIELLKTPIILPIMNIVTKIVSINKTKTGNFITPFKIVNILLNAI